MEESEPAVIWLSGLHVPESYLTALVQAACRKNGWSLDRSTLYTSVTSFEKISDITERPVTGCFIKGLYLEGACWSVEKSALCKPFPKQLVSELPVLRVIPIESHKLKLKVRFFIYYFILYITLIYILFYFIYYFKLRF